MPKAAGLADEIRKASGIESELIKGTSGVFDVTIDGKLVFSKHSAERFPETHEILDAIASHSGKH